MISPEIKSQMIVMIEEEVERIGYGKIIIEITVQKSRCTNIQAETKRSQNLNEAEPPPHNQGSGTSLRQKVA